MAWLKGSARNLVELGYLGLRHIVPKAQTQPYKPSTINPQTESDLTLPIQTQRKREKTTLNLNSHAANVNSNS